MNRSGLTTLAMLAIGTITTSCDSDSADPQLANGWVTNCSGPAFSRSSGDEISGSGPDRPVFKINDQLVLAVPRNNSPSARIDNRPRECRAISDLPRVPFLYFVIWGNWSAGYRPEDIPVVGGSKQFQPDVVGIRIEPEMPSTLSVEEQQKVARVMREWHQRDFTGAQEIGGLTCDTPKAGMEWTDCSGSQPKGGADVMKLRFKKGYSTPFVLVQADYASLRYGGIHMYWQTWTSDVSHSSDIDAAIWKSIEEWNLLSNPEAKLEQH